MQIYLVKCYADDLSLKKVWPEPNTEPEKKFSLDFSVEFPLEDNHVFSIAFNAILVHSQQYELKIKYVATFKTSEPIDDAFKTSPLAQINAPAIAFPFLRAFVSTITINSGFEPSVLPSINFINFKAKMELEKGKIHYNI